MPQVFQQESHYSAFRIRHRWRRLFFRRLLKQRRR